MSERMGWGAVRTEQAPWWFLPPAPFLTFFCRGPTAAAACSQAGSLEAGTGRMTANRSGACAMRTGTQE